MMNEENRLHIEELEKVSGGADKDEDYNTID